MASNCIIELFKYLMNLYVSRGRVKEASGQAVIDGKERGATGQVVMGGGLGKCAAGLDEVELSEGRYNYFRYTNPILRKHLYV